MVSSEICGTKKQNILSEFSRVSLHHPLGNIDNCLNCKSEFKRRNGKTTEFPTNVIDRPGKSIKWSGKIRESQGTFCFSNKSGNLSLNADYPEIKKCFDFQLKNITIIILCSR